jgi:hypothetical protein
MGDVHRRALAILLVVAAACAGGDGEQAGRTSTTTSEPSATTTTAEPTTTTTTEPPLVLPAPAQAATAGCPPVPERRSPDPQRPRYRLDVTVDPAGDRAHGTVQVRFTPDLPTERLVLRLWPNGPRGRAAGAALTVGDLRVDGEVRPVLQPDPTTLVVGLDGYVDAGTTLRIDVPWDLDLPGAANDRIARYGDTVRLGSFFPILAWEPGTGWAEDPPTTGFAEASTAPTADFDVGVTAPPELQVLASGVRQADGRWRADAMRDVAISIGRFRVVDGEAAGGVHVTVAVEAGIPDDERAYLDRVVAALDDFRSRYGPYPWPSLSLALTPGLSGGIEYPGHILQGPGTNQRTTPHEVAHMWFYGLVGNNQGRDPWLDEGLATWAEARFLGAVAAIVDRRVPPGARGEVGRPMTYWDDRPGSYHRGVYVQGAQALAALGDADRVDCALRHFVARNAFRIARPGDLVASLRQVFPDPAATLARFGA